MLIHRARDNWIAHVIVMLTLGTMFLFALYRVGYWVYLLVGVTRGWGGSAGVASHRGDEYEDEVDYYSSVPPSPSSSYPLRRRVNIDRESLYTR